MFGSKHILETSFFVFWLSRTTKIIVYVCLLTHFARQVRQNGYLNEHKTTQLKRPKYQKTKLWKWHEPSIELRPHLSYTNKFSPGGYASVITRSKSASSLNNATAGPETGRMLSDLDTALKASTNYIENHRSTQLPNGGHTEYHEYRSTTSSGTPRTVVGGDDYNLEKQVFIFCLIGYILSTYLHIS